MSRFYSSTVDPCPQALQPSDFMEMLVQGYYCLKFHKVPTCLHCLTDLRVWHIYKLCMTGADILEIKWFKTFAYSGFTPSSDDIKHHYSYVLSALTVDSARK